MNKFHKVTNKLYRGSCPNADDLKLLKKMGVKRIVSLDEECADKISEDCDKLDLEQIVVPINFTKTDVIKLINQDFKKLFEENAPTFVHCFHGKDRTGLAVGLYKIRNLGEDPQKVLDEAEKIGMGVGLDFKIANLYKKILLSQVPSDTSSANDIVSEQRDLMSDPSSIIDETAGKSFAPYVPTTKKYPYDMSYNALTEVDEYGQEKEKINEGDVALQNGVFDNSVGLHGIGPVESAGGFMTVGSLKTAYDVKMSVEFSEQEKKIAYRAIIAFKRSAKLLTDASLYLNNMGTPFKDATDISVEDIWKFRAALRRFRDKAVDNFNIFKLSAFKAVNLMSTFGTDIQVVRLIKSYVTFVEELETIVNEFVDLFNDLKNKDFVSEVNKKIKSIKDKCEDVEKLSMKRIKDHIQQHILASTWMDIISDTKQIKIDKKEPLLVELFGGDK